MEQMPSFYDEKTRIWSSSKRQSQYDFDCSLGRIIYSTMRNYPKMVCQISDTDGRTVTNAEAINWAVRIAQHFKKMGLNHEDNIGIVAKNSTYLMPVGVACFLNCTPFHALNPIMDGDTMKHLFELTKPKVIFCDGEVYEKVRLATRSFKPLIYTLNDHVQDVAKVEDLLEPTHTEQYYRPESLVQGGSQTVAILCSSGTTGMPKAVCVSNHSLLFDNWTTTCEDVIYTSSGLDWMSGVVFMVLCTTLGCTRIITTKTYTPEYFVELVEKYKMSYISLAPRHVASLLTCSSATTARLATLRQVIVGGSCISLTTLQNLQKLVNKALICFGYGLTEVGAISGNFGLAYAGSVGKILPGLRARIVDDAGNNLGPQEVGELFVQTGREWYGYYNNPFETQRIRDQCGWFHTGDLAYFDEKHFLYVVDRKKDILKYQGMQYWPGEIEHVIAELPEVADVCVVGVYDEQVGDKAGALVELRQGCKLSEQQIKDHVGKRLPVAYKQLHAGVRFVEELPQNDNGKTLRKVAKTLFIAGDK